MWQKSLLYIFVGRSVLIFVEQLKGSVKEPNKFHIYESEKITRKASDAAEYIELFGSFTRDHHVWHLVLFTERPPIYASSCMTSSSETTVQHDIFSCITGFTSDFLLPQMSAGISVGHDDLGWKNQTRNRFWIAGCSRLEYVDIRLVY